MAQLQGRARQIRLVIFDVDGVFTDGRLFYTADGEEMKVFHVRDGVGVKALGQVGVQAAVISGRASDAVALRMSELGISRIYQGNHDKLPLFAELIEQLGVSSEQTAFMGDDLPDIPVLRAVGLAACPADADAEVRSICQWVGNRDGGRGAVREFCDFLLEHIPPPAGTDV